MTPFNTQNMGTPDIVHFDGRILSRSGPGQVWLSSPSTVAASAVAGHIISFEQLRSRGTGIR